jgi:hypothetical protein
MARRNETKWVSGALSPLVKRPGREADYSPPSTADVKNTRKYLSTPTHVFMAWCLVKYRIHLHGGVVKHRGNIYLYIMAILTALM